MQKLCALSHCVHWCSMKKGEERFSFCRVKKKCKERNSRPSIPNVYLPHWFTHSLTQSFCRGQNVLFFHFPPLFVWHWSILPACWCGLEGSSLLLLLSSVPPYSPHIHSHSQCDEWMNVVDRQTDWQTVTLGGEFRQFFFSVFGSQSLSHSVLRHGEHCCFISTPSSSCTVHYGSLEANTQCCITAHQDTLKVRARSAKRKKENTKQLCAINY